MAKLQVYQDLNNSGKILVQGLGAFIRLDLYGKVQSELEAHKVNTALIAGINEYCQKNKIGECGDSSSAALLRNLEALRLERDALAAKLEQVKSSYKNLCSAISDADGLEAGTEDHEQAVCYIFEAMREGWCHVND